MSRVRAPGVAHQQARHIVTHLLGSGRLTSILKVMVVLIAIGWFGDSLFEWWTDIGLYLKGGAVSDWWPLHRLFAVLFLAVIVTRLWWLARQAEAHTRPTVVVDSRPRRASGLILYLSPLGSEELQKLQDGLPALTGLEAFRQRFGGWRWRMPLEAITYHLPTLRRVVVISSAHGGGSRRQVPVFKALADRLFPGADLRVQDVAELDSSYEPGLDFEDVEKVAAATDDAYVRLRSAGLDHEDILIDVTGGAKTSSVAGAVVALAEGRRIQYVTSRYQVLVYDVTYHH